MPNVCKPCVANKLCDGFTETGERCTKTHEEISEMVEKQKWYDGEVCPFCWFYVGLIGRDSDGKEHLVEWCKGRSSFVCDAEEKKSKLEYWKREEEQKMKNEKGKQPKPGTSKCPKCGKPMKGKFCFGCKGK